MPKHVWRSHFVPGSFELLDEPRRLSFSTRVDFPKTYNGRSMAGRIITVDFGHTLVIGNFLDEFNTALRELGSKLPDTMG